MTFRIDSTHRSIRQILLVAFMAFSAGAQASVQQNGPPPALVETAKASNELMAPQTYLPGTVVSLNDSRIAAEIAGRVTWIASEGTFLGEGDVLAKIDDRKLKLTAAQRKSQISGLEARIKYLRSDLARVTELAANNTVPASRLEAAQSTLAIAEQDLVQAKVQYEMVLVDLERTVVRAPFPGRIVERLAQIGEYSAPGRQIVRLVDTEHLEVSAKAPVTLASVLRDGQQAVLQDAGTLIDTRIRAIVPVGDDLSRTMELRVSLPKDSRHVVGAALQIGVPSDLPENVVTVPRDALILRRDGTYVFRVNGDNTAERIAVDTGSATGAYVAVSGGIKGGDTVIIRGGERLRPGQSVQEQNDTADADATHVAAS